MLKALRCALLILTALAFLLAGVWAIAHHEIQPEPTGIPVQLGADVKCSQCGKATREVFTCQDCEKQKMCLDCLTDHECNPESVRLEWTLAHRSHHPFESTSQAANSSGSSVISGQPEPVHCRQRWQSPRHSPAVAHGRVANPFDSNSAIALTIRRTDILHPNNCISVRMAI